MANTTQTETKLLTIKERNACRKIAGQNAGLASQRAAALLAVDAGETQAEASGKTELSRGQIRYLMAAFRQKRMEMFSVETASPKPAAVKKTPAAPTPVATTVKTETKDEKPEKAQKAVPHIES